MSRRLGILFLYSMLSLQLYAQNDPRTDSAKMYIPANALMKFAWQLNGNTLLDQSLNFNMGIGGEIGLKENFSINFIVSLNYAFDNPELELPVQLEARYYLNKDALIANHKVIHPEKVLSGTYLSPSFTYFGKSYTKGWNHVDSIRHKYSILTYIPQSVIGIKFGRQFFGAIDFGVFAGIERAVYKDIYYEPEKLYNIDIRTFPQVSTYFKATLPLGSFNKKLYFKTNCAETNCIDTNKPLLKIGLQNVLNLSKAGLFFKPQLAYEIPLGKSFTSVNLDADAYFIRSHYYDVDFSKSIWESSDKPWLNQAIQFEANPQFRWYALNKIRAKKCYSVTKTEGLYLQGEFYYTTGTREIRRQVWEFQRNSSSGIGAGIGYQKMLFRRILMDIYNTYIYTGDEHKTGYPYAYKGGIQFYWLK